MKKKLKFDCRHLKMYEPMATKIGRDDYVQDIHPCAKIALRSDWGTLPSGYAKLPTKCSLG